MGVDIFTGKQDGRNWARGDEEVTRPGVTVAGAWDVKKPFDNIPWKKLAVIAGAAFAAFMVLPKLVGKASRKVDAARTRREFLDDDEWRDEETTQLVMPRESLEQVVRRGRRAA